MSPLAIAVLSLSMSADAFAAAIGRGAAHRPSLAGALRAGLVFGLIEAATPIIGWSLGLAASRFVMAVDHWIAFGLLGAVGGKMAFEAFRRPDPEQDGPERGPRRGWLVLVATAVGTSIDAAAVGVTLALLNVGIIGIALSIGFASFTMSTIGMMIGRAAGARLGAAFEFFGGLALIGLGIRILLEHLGIVA